MMKLKERTKLFWLFVFLVIFIISVVIYVLYDLSLYNSYEFTVLEVETEENYILGTKLECMTKKGENDFIIGYFPVAYRLHVKDVRIVNMDNKEIKLSDIEVGDKIQVIKKTKPNQMVLQFSNYHKYLKNILLVKLISKGNT